MYFEIVDGGSIFNLAQIEITMKYVDIPFLMQYRKTYLPAVGLGLSVAVIGDSEAEIEYMKYEEVYHFYIKKETNCM